MIIIKMIFEWYQNPENLLKIIKIEIIKIKRWFIKRIIELNQSFNMPQARKTTLPVPRKPRKGGIEAVIVDLLYQFFITEEGEYSTDNS